jgi:hypothetical protein
MFGRTHKGPNYKLYDQERLIHGAKTGDFGFGYALGDASKKK